MLSTLSRTKYILDAVMKLMFV